MPCLNQCYMRRDSKPATWISLRDLARRGSAPPSCRWSPILSPSSSVCNFCSPLPLVLLPPRLVDCAPKSYVAHGMDSQSVSKPARLAMGQKLFLPSLPPFLCFFGVTGFILRAAFGPFGVGIGGAAPNTKQQVEKRCKIQVGCNAKMRE